MRTDVGDGMTRGPALRQKSQTCGQMWGEALSGCRPGQARWQDSKAQEGLEKEPSLNRANSLLNLVATSKEK